MYEDKTKAVVRQAILDAMGNSISKIEGSFASDMAAAVALEMSKIYAHMDYAVQTFLLQTNEGEYLERRAAEYGITRKAGTKATATLTVTGVDGATFPAGAQILSPSGLIFVTGAAATISGGTVTVTATAAAAGAAYNVAAGSLTQLIRNIVGITSVTNAAAATGGTDDETDAALRERVLFRLQLPITSGNANHYRQWALEVDGVGAAKVIPLWNGNGTVKVIVASSDMGTVSSGVIDAVETHIEAERPIGASVTVVSATTKAIAVSAAVTIASTTSLTAVQADFEAKLAAYLKDIAFDASSVPYNKIAYLLMSCDGVNNHSGLSVNSGTADISLATGEIPTKGTVTLSAAA